MLFNEHSSTLSNVFLSETYNLPLIFISVLIAVLVSFSAFINAERMFSARSQKQKNLWHLFGTIALGLGLWSMHFVALAAIELPFALSYDTHSTLLSMIPSMIAGAVMLWLMATDKFKVLPLIIAGAFLGAGVSIMHHISMTALPAHIRVIHDPALFYMSLLFSAVTATAALWLQQVSAHPSRYKLNNKKHLSSALVMGLGISSIHFFSMSTSNFSLVDVAPVAEDIDQNSMFISTFAIAFLVLLVAVLVPYMLRYKQVSEDLKHAMVRLNLGLEAANQNWFDLDIASGDFIEHQEQSESPTQAPEHRHTNLRHWIKSLHPDDQHASLEAIQNCLRSSKSCDIESRQKGKEGDWLWFHTVIKIVEWNKQGKPSRAIGIHTDITRDKHTHLVLSALAEGDSTTNTLNEIVRLLAQFHNMRYALIARINREDKSVVDTLAVWSGDSFLPNFSYDLKGTPCKNVLNNGVCTYENNIQSLFPNDLILASMSAESYIGVPLNNSQGELIGLIALLDTKPIPAKTQATELFHSLTVRAGIEIERRELMDNLTLSSRVFTDSQEGILITDKYSNIIDANPAFSRLTQYSREEVIGKNPSVLRSGSQSDEFYAQMWQGIQRDGHWQGEIQNRKKDGEVIIEFLNISALKDEQGEITNYIGLFSDITHYKQQQDTLEKMAHYDVLTQLPNRVLFSDRFDHAIAHSKRTETQLGICFLDVDNFKPLNDEYGHEVGDQLLIEVAKRIKAIIREEDTVSRQGGDEFAFLLGDIRNTDQCQMTIDRIHLSLSKPFEINGHSHNMSASSGVTLYPSDDADIDTLLRHADQAMYQAKQEGKRRNHFFNPQLDQAAVEKHHRLEELQLALVNNEFELYYQPKVNMITGKVYGAEALIRWIHPEKGLIPPLDFLPVLEGSELENKVGYWVIHQALLQLEDWQNQGIMLEVSVNISSNHLQSPCFFDQLDDALKLHPSVDPKTMQLEILESSELGNLEKISDIIQACQQKIGVNIALDDFGTGYSSLTHLRNLSANTIKIDQSFVKDMLDDPNDFAIIDGVIGLSDSFHREIIAEGVESTNHGLMLLIMGCEHAQGYCIARPMPAPELPTWLENYVPNQDWLQCGQQLRDNKEIKVELYRLTSRQWQESFCTNINTSPDKIKHWPIMDSHKCHCGYWLKRAKQENLFDQDVIRDLDHAHEDIHNIAAVLLEQYRSGELDSAKMGLPKLQVAFGIMRDVLDHRVHSQPTTVDA